jgi:hypothetical protein
VLQRLQGFCDLAYTAEILSRGIFTLRMPCSVTRTSQVALQSTGGKRGIKPLAFFCMVHGASAGIHAAERMANLQVFCRENSGNGCPVSVCLGSLLRRGPCGHAWRATHGTRSLRSNTAGASSHTVVI